MDKKRKTTIKDIAEIAKCSLSTVSKALNDRSDVSAVTRKRILEIADDYNFVPNVFDKRMKKQTTENIGVIFCREQRPLSGNPFYSRILEGIEGELAINNYNLVLQLLSEDYKNEIPKMLRERNVDGVLLMGIYKDAFINDLQSRNIPLVLVNPNISTDNFNQILIDNEHGAYLATQHLIDNGHKRIAFISEELNRISFQQRFLGYKQALKYNNIPLRPEYIHTSGSEQGYQQVENLLKLEECPTAIFAANDLNAIYGYNAIKNLGYRVPQDISLVGFDDIDLSKIASPPLTTIRVYKEEMGSIAVRILLKVINKEIIKPATIIVPIKLVERSSVAKITE